MKIERQSRAERTKMTPGSVYLVASLELLNSIKRRLKNSKKYDDGINYEPIFCIPALLSCIRILALEIENEKEGNKKNNYRSELISKLKKNKRNDIDEILEFYGVSEVLKNDFKLLNEIRHEIIHPSPFPENGFSLPSYLSILKKKKIIWMAPAENFACNIYWHFRCHELFEWSFERFIQLSKYVIESKPYNEHLMEIYKQNFLFKGLTAVQQIAQPDRELARLFLFRVMGAAG